MNIEIGDSVKIVNAIDPIKMVVIDKIDNFFASIIAFI